MRDKIKSRERERERVRERERMGKMIRFTNRRKHVKKKERGDHYKDLLADGYICGHYD